jgi:DNA-binding NarL/FixJ family response regulator
VVDGQRLFAQALASWLARQPGFDVIGTAQSISQARSVLDRQAADVQLVDIDLGADSGIDLIDDARSRNPPPRSVVLTATTSPAAVATAVRHGAASRLSKRTDGDMLTRVLRGVLHDEGWIPPPLLFGLLRTLTARSGGPLLDQLTNVNDKSCRRWSTE